MKTEARVMPRTQVCHNPIIVPYSGLFWFKFPCQHTIHCRIIESISYSPVGSSLEGSEPNQQSSLNHQLLDSEDQEQTTDEFGNQSQKSTKFFASEKIESYLDQRGYRHVSSNKTMLIATLWMFSTL